MDKTFFGKMFSPKGDRSRPANGLPGAELESGTITPDMEGMLLSRKPGQTVIGEKDIRKAAEILKEYKRGKANLEERIVNDELWWELRHWESIGKNRDGSKKTSSPEPSSAWLFNSILNKHADAMDNFPEPIVLPREMSDKDSAKTLTQVLPTVLEYNNFEQTYSDNWWEKLKHGTAAYGVFWNNEKENGLGDIDIRQIDLLKLFWEPGITDIQKSRNLFIVELTDDDILEKMYPEHKDKMKGTATVDVKKYLYDDDVDTSGKSVVVDWYYKVKGLDGRTVLHYAKFVGDALLYASENDENYALRGFYDHGQYPVVADVLFPEKGTPIGFGYVAICKDPQLYIDKLSGNILETSMMHTKKRYFASTSTNINKDQFLDWNEPIVDVEGEINDTKIREIEISPLNSVYLNVVNMKIEEMKDTASNRDVNSGGVGSGVTAAAAIAALQEAGNKSSRDMISASYRAYTEITRLCIELIRQFYDEARTFRITAPNGAAELMQAKDGKPQEYSFVQMDNSKLRDQPIGRSADGVPLFRRPIFDLKIKAQKKNPFSRMEQNENTKELYRLGFFNPQNAQQSLLALEMMDFEGIEQMKERIAQGQTLFNMVQELQKENLVLRTITGQIQEGINPGAMTGTTPPPADTGDKKDTISDKIMEARTPMTGYGQALAKRSTPDMSEVRG